MANDWYPRDILAWRGGTRHMTLAEKGAYTELIDEYMSGGKALVDNERVLASFCGCTVDEWQAVSPVVLAKFERTNGKLVQKRCEEEIYARSMRQASRKRKAKYAANKRWMHHRLDAKGNAPGMLGAMLDDAMLKKDRKIDSLLSREGASMIINGKEAHPTQSLLDLTARQNKDRRAPTPSSSATALPTGAPPPPANTQPVAVNGKAVHNLTRVELEALYVKKRPVQVLNPADEEGDIPF